MFGLKTSSKRIETTRADLVAARVLLKAIEAGENEASETTETYAKWRTSRDAATLEVKRLETLVDALDVGGEEQRRREADAELRKRIEASRKANVDLARRLKGEGKKLSADLIALMQNVARAKMEADALNEALPADLAPIEDANFLARGKAAVPRTELDRKTITLWAFAATGNLVGDQDAVRDTGASRGYVDAGRGFIVDCVRRKFLSTSYHPAEAAHYPDPIYTELRLPSFDSPDILYDGARMTADDLALPSPSNIKAQRRPIETELEPLEREPEPRSEIGEVFARLNAERAL